MYSIWYTIEKTLLLHSISYHIDIIPVRGACPEKSHHAGLNAHPATSDYTASAATTTPLIPNCSATPNETSAIAATVFISIYQTRMHSILLVVF